MREHLGIFRLEGQVLERGLRRGDRFFVKLAIPGTNGVIRRQELPRRPAIRPKLLNADRLSVSELGPCCLVRLFFFGKSLNNFCRRERRRRDWLGHAFDACHMVLWGGLQRSGRVFLCE